MAWARVSSSAVAPVPVGAVIPFAGIAAPSDWLLCDGSAVSRTTYSTLFSSITLVRTFTTTNGSSVVGSGDTTSLAAGMFVEGTGIPSGATISSIGSSTGFALSSNATASGTVSLRFFAFGRGDGSATFHIPDFRGRVAMGSGTGAGSQNTSSPLSGSGLPSGGGSLTARVVGQWGGQENHTLSTSALPSHTHPITSDGSHIHTQYGRDYAWEGIAGRSDFAWGRSDAGGANMNTASAGAHAHGGATSSTGDGSSHNNAQPFTVAHYIIRAV